MTSRADEVDPPLVITGMGGSGTRAVAYVLRACGLYLGVNTNGVKEDALEFAEFDYRWTPPFLARRRDGTRFDETAMSEEHAGCVAAHRSGFAHADGPWGWKHCPSGHLLPFLAGRFPQMALIHVVRDGRDMAFGEHGGRTHTLRLGRAVLDGDPEPVTPGSDTWCGKAPAVDGSPEATPLRQARFWDALNREIAAWGASVAPDRYLRVRLEELVARPEAGVRALTAFARLPEPSTVRREALVAHLAPPSTLGRWRDQAPAAVRGVTGEMGQTLDAFGYGV